MSIYDGDMSDREHELHLRIEDLEEQLEKCERKITTWEERTKLIEAGRKRRDGLMFTKGKDYSRSDDSNANFKRVGDLLGIKPEMALLVYLEKQLDAIRKFITTGRVESEPIQSRVDDAINYLEILETLLIESGAIK